MLVPNAVLPMHGFVRSVDQWRIRGAIPTVLGSAASFRNRDVVPLCIACRRSSQPRDSPMPVSDALLLAYPLPESLRRALHLVINPPLPGRCSGVPGSLALSRNAKGHSPNGLVRSQK